MPYLYSWMSRLHWREGGSTQNPVDLLEWGDRFGFLEKPMQQREIEKFISVVGNFNTLLRIINRISRQKICKDIENHFKNHSSMWANIPSWNSPTTTAEYTHSFQVFMEHLLRQNIVWATSQILIDLKRFRSKKGYSLTMVKLS